MTKRLGWICPCILLIGWLMFTGCSNDVNRGGGGAANANAGEDVATGPDTTAGEDAGDDPDVLIGENATPGPEPHWDGTEVSSCAELEGSADCMSHLDCPTSQICLDIGWPCCIVGERGTTEPGQDCDEDEGELECSTGMCIQGTVAGNDVSLCSTPCTSVEDCPEGMKRCQALAFTDSDWCFPAE
ncbi:MAG: hypothetical protein ACNA8W_07180 [Bradymonadaceae bacterium]